MLRRSRRNRKTRYRKPRFLNRVASKKEGWLPPSINSRLDNTVRWINRFQSLLPNCNLHIEVGKFDIQKIENPDIVGEGYQQGTMYEYRNKIAYLLDREHGVCQYCNSGYKKGDGWRLHHIWGRDKDRPKDWALVHESCHKKMHLKGEEGKLRKKKSKSYKESTFMNIIRRKFFTIFPATRFTYGNYTFQDRIDLGLEKTHYNDAIAITRIKEVKANPETVFYIQQARKKKRSLHEANARKGRKTKNVLARRNNKNTKESGGVFLNDKIKLGDEVGFVTGFSGKYTTCVVNIQGDYLKIKGNKSILISLSKISVIAHNNNWRYISDLKEEKYLTSFK
jgi:hypothetical protein